MRKISLYKFVTTFCLVPTTDWGAFVQRVILRLLLVNLFFRLLSLLKQPLAIAGLIGLLIWAPETIMWIFIRIGDIELRVMALVLASLMPDIFNAGGGAFESWSALWSQALTLLPADMLSVINGLGVGQLMGIMTGTFTAVSSIKIYRKIMIRAGLF